MRFVRTRELPFWVSVGVEFLMLSLESSFSSSRLFLLSIHFPGCSNLSTPRHRAPQFIIVNLDQRSRFSHCSCLRIRSAFTFPFDGWQCIIINLHICIFLHLRQINLAVEIISINIPKTAKSRCGVIDWYNFNYSSAPLGVMNLFVGVWHIRSRIYINAVKRREKLIVKGESEAFRPNMNSS
jgi:hypothetical protein